MTEPRWRRKSTPRRRRRPRPAPSSTASKPSGAPACRTDRAPPDPDPGPADRLAGAEAAARHRLTQPIHSIRTVNAGNRDGGSAYAETNAAKEVSGSESAPGTPENARVSAPRLENAETPGLVGLVGGILTPGQRNQ